jgi:hypothetical protein
LNKAIEEKKTEASKEQGQDNNGNEKNQNQEQEHLSLSTQAYKLFSERKTPLEVAIALNLRESEATKFYKEYWKLRQLHNLNMIYEETKGDIESFLKLHKLAKKQGMSREQIVKLLQLADEDKRKTEDIIKFKNKINII